MTYAATRLPQRARENLFEPRHGLPGGLAVDDRVDLQLASADHLDVDVVRGLGLEQQCRDLSVASQTDSADGHFGNPIDALHRAHPVTGSDFFGNR